MVPWTRVHRFADAVDPRPGAGPLEVASRGAAVGTVSLVAKHSTGTAQPSDRPRRRITMSRDQISGPPKQDNHSGHWSPQEAEQPAPAFSSMDRSCNGISSPINDQEPGAISVSLLKRKS